MSDAAEEPHDRAELFKAEMAEVRLADPSAAGERRTAQVGIALMVLGGGLVLLGGYGAAGVSPVWEGIP